MFNSCRSFPLKLRLQISIVLTWHESLTVDDGDVVAVVKEVVHVDLADGRQRNGELVLLTAKVLLLGLAVKNDLSPD